MDQSVLLKRWTEKLLYSESFGNWVCSERKFGDVSFLGIEQSQYLEHIVQSFSNAAVRSEKMINGTTHVSIGFVDLGSLIHSDIIEQPSCDEPFTWVGLKCRRIVSAKP